jgi:mono/diheme cytochrome c family protein
MPSRSVAIVVLSVVAASAYTAGQQRPTGSVAAAAQGGAAQVGAQAKAGSGSVDHGRYLVERVVHCAECHSSRDADGNIIPETRFKGGPMVVRPPWPMDWPTAFPRIAGLPGYTDEQATRLLTQGAIKRDGTQLRAPMPRFRMTPQDAADVIAFLRTL